MERKPSAFHILLLIFALIGMACDKDTTVSDNFICSDDNIKLAQNGEDETVGCSVPVLAPNDEELVENPDEVEVPVQTPDEDFQRAAEADLEINAYLRDFSSTQESKMNSALVKLNIVLNSEEFRIKVLNHSYNGSKTFVNNNGQNNQEIYETILKGAETLNGIEDQEVDVDITLYYSNNSIVGYTYPNVNRIWVNNKFFSTYTHGSVAANVVHEWLHKLGYGHDFDRTTRRNYSVPYGIGGIVRELVNKL